MPESISNRTGRRTQPDHGEEQIKFVGELALGMTLLDGCTRIEVASEPFQDEAGKWKVKIERFGKEKEIFLSDRGVVPYDGGNWNQDCWLERLEPDSP